MDLLLIGCHKCQEFTWLPSGPDPEGTISPCCPVSDPGGAPTLPMAQLPMSAPQGCQSLPQGCPSPKVSSYALMYRDTFGEKLLANSSQTVLLDEMGEREAWIHQK